MKRRRAAFVLSGGFVVAGALVAPAALVAAEPLAPTDPSISIACIDRTVALLPVTEAGLGLGGVTPLPPVPLQEPVPSTNPAVAVVTLTNPGLFSFDVLVARDGELPVPFTAAPGATVSAAFDVTDAGTSVFRVTDLVGTELALISSTGDCTPPPGWCDAERAPGSPVAADHADVCPLPGDEVFTVPEATATDPAPTGKVVDGAPEVLGAALFQTPSTPSTPSAPPLPPPDAIVMPSATPPTAAPAPSADEQAAPAAPAPELARSGSFTDRLAQLAAMLLGVGAVVGTVGRRRVDVELDDRASDAMARIFAAAGRD